MPRLKLYLAYDGRAYQGWARQVEKGVERPSIEGELVKAFSELKAIEGKLEIAVAGRTDAGVHAVGQVVHVDGLTWREEIKYLDGLNHALPGDIRVDKDVPFKDMPRGR